MRAFIGNIVLLMLSSTMITCNGQHKPNRNSTEADETSEITKIPVPKNGFRSAYHDKDSTLWFSSNGGGVFHFDGRTFTNYTEENGLSSNQVYSITADHNNNLWFGTQNGLSKYNRKQFEHILLPYQDTASGWIKTVYPVLNPNAAYSLATDNDDKLWIGTAGGGAYQYDGVTFKPYLRDIGSIHEDGSYHNWVHDIEKDAEGNMWFASMSHGGISQFDGDTFTHYSITDGLSDDMVRTIYCDKSGIIWVGVKGSNDSGLSAYDGQDFKKYTVADGLDNTRVFAIYEDKNGHVWIGGNLGKLYVFDGQDFSEFSQNGQTYANILFILGDSEDNIWFGGSDGLWRYDGRIVTELTIHE